MTHNYNVVLAVKLVQSEIVQADTDFNGILWNCDISIQPLYIVPLYIVQYR